MGLIRKRRDEDEDTKLVQFFAAVYNSTYDL